MAWSPIETIDPHFPSLQVAQFGFAREEIEAPRDTTPSRRAHAFTALWVLKEAYVKALGQGFFIPLDSFAVGLDPPALLRTAHGSSGTMDWRFHLYHPTLRHLMALASSARAPARIEVGEWMLGDIEDSLAIFVPRDAKGPTHQDGARGLQPRRMETFEAGAR
jgi:4'-phosphopantetheinyl transferase superfamily